MAAIDRQHAIGTDRGLRCRNAQPRLWAGDADGNDSRRPGSAMPAGRANATVTARW